MALPPANSNTLCIYKKSNFIQDKIFIVSYIVHNIILKTEKLAKASTINFSIWRKT